MLRYSAIGMVATVLATGALTGRPGEAVSEAGAPATIGVYDPAQDYRKVAGMAIEHVFIPWQSFDPQALRERARYAAERGRQMLVTVEPWTKAANWTDGGDTLFADILAGGYDDAIRASCAEIARMDGLVMVRWGHEMEEATGRYPWARADSAGYVAAYRYVVSKCRSIAPKARFVWSPLGHAQLGRYYPGDAFVDAIGLPVWGYQEADRRWYGHDRGLREALGEKYERVAGYGKPVIIAEFGVVGSPAYQAEWLSAIAGVRASFPLVRSVVYFNMAEPADWPDGLGRPDWRVSPERFGELSNLI